MTPVRSVSFASLTLLTAAHSARAATGDDAELARSARLETILRVALERNRDVAENEARARAAEARSQAASRLARPGGEVRAVGRTAVAPAGARPRRHVDGRPAPDVPRVGVLDARGRAAAGGRGRRAGRRRAPAARRSRPQVRRTYATYYRADQELRLHLEHVGLTSRVLELAKLNQRTGHGGLQDVLRLELELTRLHTDVARIEREQRSSRALLNALMDRAPDAPLGPPEELHGHAATKDVAALERNVDATPARGWRRRRGRCGAARRCSTARAERRACRASWSAPTTGTCRWASRRRTPTARWSSINLPWLIRPAARRGARGRSRRCRPTGTRSTSTRNAVRYELRDAAARLDAARQSFTIIDQNLLAQARRSLEATQAAYAAGQGDALALLDALRVVPAGAHRARARAGASWPRARRISSAPPGRWRVQGGQHR